MQILYTVSDDFCATWQMNRKPGNAVYAFCGGRTGKNAAGRRRRKKSPGDLTGYRRRKLCKTNKR